MRTFISSFSRTCLLAALALAAATGIYAQQKPEQNYQLDDDTIEAIDAYRIEGEKPDKDYAKMLSLIDNRLAKLKNKNSYDYTMLLQFKAKIFIEKAEYAKALEPMEQGLIVSDAQTPTYLDERTSNEICYFLAQLYFQETNNPAISKNHAVELQYFDKTENYTTRWLKNIPKPTSDGLYFYATVLYTRGVIDEKHVDKDRIVHALDWINQWL